MTVKHEASRGFGPEEGLPDVHSILYISETWNVCEKSDLEWIIEFLKSLLFSVFKVFYWKNGIFFVDKQ